MATPYSNSIAQLGQTDAQHPQLRQISLSMTTFPSFSEIAFTGQTSAHSKHFWHFSATIFTVLPQQCCPMITVFKLKSKKQKMLFAEGESFLILRGQFVFSYHKNIFQIVNHLLTNVETGLTTYSWE